MSNDFGWLARVHVYPTQDLKEHTLENCWCDPQPDALNEDILIHNSADAREKFETGERKTS